MKNRLRLLTGWVYKQVNEERMKHDRNNPEFAFSKEPAALARFRCHEDRWQEGDPMFQYSNVGSPSGATLAGLVNPFSEIFPPNRRVAPDQ